jgi:16S rRNA (adenine1518-N6/adenine1519-N6)-dimethyltransferase
MSRRRLGQHFLFDPSILERIVDTAGIGPDDLVIEIGPGRGTLTRLIAERAAEVIAIEIDSKLHDLLVHEFRDNPQVRIVNRDFLEYPLPGDRRFKAIGNIPYYITTPILFKLLEEGRMLESATLTIQKEVAERIVAGPGTKRYGVLSVMAQYRSEPRIAFTIPRRAFSPPPKVDSALLYLSVLPERRLPLKDEALFFRVVRTAFSQRRKMLSNSLKPLGKEMGKILELAGIDPRRRPETLSIEEFGRIADLLAEIS